MTPRRCFRSSALRQHATAVHRLRLAAESGSVAAVAALLDPSVEMVTDGGGKTAAQARVLRAPLRVAQRICDVLETQPAAIAEREVNGESGLVLTRDGQVAAVVCVSVDRRRITDLWVVLNPDKLRHWNRPAR